MAVDIKAMGGAQVCAAALGRGGVALHEALGQSPLWREAKAAHQQWLAQQPDAKSLADGWPFDKTDVMALMPTGLALKYQPYSIGPYSMGTPEIVIPYERLTGIFKPDYLPLR